MGAALHDLEVGKKGKAESWLKDSGDGGVIGNVALRCSGEKGWFGEVVRDRFDGLWGAKAYGRYVRSSLTVSYGWPNVELCLDSLVDVLISGGATLRLFCSSLVYLKGEDACGLSEDCWCGDCLGPASH